MFNNGICGEKLHYPWFCKKISTNQRVPKRKCISPAQFSAALILEVFFHLFFYFKVMHFTPLTKPTSYEENNNITNSDLKQKSTLKSYKKTKDCELLVRERTTNLKMYVEM